MAEQYGVDKARVMMDDDGKKGTSAAVKLAFEIAPSGAST